MLITIRRSYLWKETARDMHQNNTYQLITTYELLFDIKITTTLLRPNIVSQHKLNIIIVQNNRTKPLHVTGRLKKMKFDNWCSNKAVAQFFCFSLDLHTLLDALATIWTSFLRWTDKVFKILSEIFLHL